MGPWVVLAAAIAAGDVALGRAGRPLLSHTCWDSLTRPRAAAVPHAVTAALTIHLLGRARWPQSIAVGLTVGIAHATATPWPRPLEGEHR